MCVSTDPMKILEPASPLWTERVLSLLRIIVGFIFITHGTAKLFGFPAGANPAPLADFFSQRWLAGVLEVFGGALVMIGFLTRPVAFLLSGQMAVAYFQAHFPRSFWPTVNGGVSAALYCFIFFYICFAGPGPWSLDAAIWRRHRHA